MENFINMKPWEVFLGIYLSLITNLYTLYLIHKIDNQKSCDGQKISQ